MNKTTKLIIAALALAVLVGGAAMLYNKLAPANAPEALTPSQSAPDSAGDNAGEGSQEPADELVEAYDFTASDANGNEVALSSLRGKPVVLNFWATWCGYCVQEMPDFDEVYSEYGDRVEFMMLNATDEGSGETADKAKAFVAEKGYSFPVYFDTLGEGTAAYGVSGLPTTVVIDEKGYVYGYATGMISGDALRNALDGALALYE